MVAVVSPRLVRFGSLDVPARAADDFALAVRYLARDARMRDIIERAEHAAHRVHVRMNARDDDSFDPVTGTIHWDPHSALRTTGGGRQSPALGLGHELDHATADPRVRDAGADAVDRRYDDREERRVVTGSERHAARTLGEDVRCDHAGRCYRVATPVSR